MTDPDKNVVAMVTDVLKGYQKTSVNQPIVMGYIDGEENVEVFAYLNCNYTDLRRLATAISDEATLWMIARNQDRIDKLKDDNAE